MEKKYTIIQMIMKNVNKVPFFDKKNKFVNIFWGMRPCAADSSKPVFMYAIDTKLKVIFFAQLG